MGEVETALMYMAGLNQYQDPGLDEDTRRAAIRAVKHAKNRDVFYLDEILSLYEERSQLPGVIGVWYTAQADIYMEEMLSHGSR